MVAIAMSGGLDSSMAAWILAREETPVLGLSMLLWDHSQEEVTPGGGRCCGALDLVDARRVAEQIGIPHYTLTMDEAFRETVVDPFVDDYLHGRTPSPCVRCNTFVKFDLLHRKAEALGATRVATGHYARVVDGPDGPELHRGLDESKDQSYFLFELTQAQLARSLFPLGELTKLEVRAQARQAQLLVAEKGESQEICFVSSSIQSFVEREVARRPERFSGAPGAGATMTAPDGEVLGEGAPYYRYTVGQRRGLGVASNRRLYVLRVLPEENRVEVGDRRALARGGLLGKRVHWIGPAPSGAIETTVRIRARHPGAWARVTPQPNQRARVDFVEEQLGIAPGQAAVFYSGTQVLGGCWIESSFG